MLIYFHNKCLRRIFEAAAFPLFNSLNTRPGFYNISPYLSKYILNSHNIFPSLFNTFHIYHHFMLFLFLFLFFFFFFLLIRNLSRYTNVT